jgi:hypothetical protein
LHKNIPNRLDFHFCAGRQSVTGYEREKKDEAKMGIAFEEGDGKNKMLLGGKGANLCEMTQIGLNVPPGFTITTDACLAYLEHDELAPGRDGRDPEAHMKDLEQKTGKSLAAPTIRCWCRCAPVPRCPCRA